jgi:hypothetical protein
MIKFTKVYFVWYALGKSIASKYLRLNSDPPKVLTIQTDCSGCIAVDLYFVQFVFLSAIVRAFEAIVDRN